MSVSGITARNRYTGNGATSTYSYTFPITAKSDLLVTLRDTENTEITLALDTDYSVTGEGSASGGTVVLINTNQDWLTSGHLKSGYIIAIRRNFSLTQPTDIRNQGTFYPETHEDAFDRGILIDQQQQDQITRSLKFPETDSVDTDVVLPCAAHRINSFLAFDAYGNPITSNGGIPGAIPVSTFMETLLDDTTEAVARATLGAVGQGGDQSIYGVKIFETQLIGKGTTTNDSAATGYIGEYVSAFTGSFVPGSSGTWSNVTSISLTAGDWDVSAVTFWSAGTSVTEISMGISTTTGNSTTGLTYGDNRVAGIGPVSGTHDESLSIPCYRMSVAVTTTVYLKYACTFSVGPNTYGRISARRAR